MITISNELEELLDAEKKAEEEEKELSAKFLWLLMQHESNFLHQTDDKIFVETYANFVDEFDIVFTTVKSVKLCNAHTFVALKELDSMWMD